MTAPADRAAQPLYQRMEPALLLACHRMGSGPRYRVTGGKEAHYVDVDALTCDCADFAYRGEERLCKHLIASLLREGDQAAVQALGSHVDSLCPLLLGAGDLTLGGSGWDPEHPVSWLRADPAIDCTFYRFPLKEVIVAGLGDTGIVYARWPNGFELQRGFGQVDVVPDWWRPLMAVLFAEVPLLL